MLHQSPGVSQVFCYPHEANVSQIYFENNIPCFKRKDKSWVFACWYISGDFLLVLDRWVQEIQDLSRQKNLTYTCSLLIL